MTNEILAFTGPSTLLDDQIPAVMQGLSLLEAPREARYGCAKGADTMTQGWGLAFWPDTAHRLYVPAAPHNHKLVEPFRKDRDQRDPRDQRFDVQVIDCPKAGTKTYRVRNSMMVAGATRLIAFVKSDTYYRSGEWMTINMAEREFGIPVELVLLNRLEA